MTSPDLLAAAVKAAWDDFDQAAAAYDTDPCEANRAAYEAATWATQALVTRQIEVGNDQP